MLPPPPTVSSGDLLIGTPTAEPPQSATEATSLNTVKALPGNPPPERLLGGANEGEAVATAAALSGIMDDESASAASS
jgi:hypothetical protein